MLAGQCRGRVWSPRMTPVIIEAAINGVTTKQRNPHVPQAPQEIAADALRCVAAGAAIVHNHIDVVTTDADGAGGVSGSD